MKIELPQQYKKYADRLQTICQDNGLTIDGTHLATDLGDFGLPQAETIAKLGKPARISIHWNNFMRIAGHCGALELLAKYGTILDQENRVYRDIAPDLREKLIATANALQQQVSALVASGITIQTQLA